MKAEDGILKGELKVKGGKLIRCRMKIKDGKIEEIKFSGDFFMHPEEKIEELERMMAGVKLDEENIKCAISRFSENVEMVGITADDLVEAIINVKEITS